MRHAWLQICEGGLEAGAAENYQGGAGVVDEVVDEHIAVPERKRCQSRFPWTAADSANIPKRCLKQPWTSDPSRGETSQINTV